MVIGLTGGIGSGKSTAANYLVDHYPLFLIDADLLAREVVEPNTPALEKIFQHFGLSLRLPDGTLDRKKLRKIIFHDKNEKVWLEKLLHPIIRTELLSRLNQGQPKHKLLVSPLLFETDQHQLCDKTIVIESPEQAQLSRVMQRDKTDEATIKNIIASQMDSEQRCAKADFVVYNNGTLEHLHQQLNDAMAQLNIDTK